jgi:hypothetical protein
MGALWEPRPRADGGWSARLYRGEGAGITKERSCTHDRARSIERFLPTDFELPHNPLLRYPGRPHGMDGQRLIVRHQLPTQCEYTVEWLLGLGLDLEEIAHKRASKAVA